MKANTTLENLYVDDSQKYLNHEADAIQFR